MEREVAFSLLSRHILNWQRRGGVVNIHPRKSPIDEKDGDAGMADKMQLPGGEIEHLEREVGLGVGA